MIPQQPFNWLSNPAQRRAFFIFTLLSVLVMLVLASLSNQLKSHCHCDNEIVRFELAGEQSQAAGIVNSWGPEGRIIAGLSLGLDYLYIVAYVISISLGCVLVAQKLSQYSRTLYVAGLTLAWLQLPAGLLDGIENFALIKILLGAQEPFYAPLARWCAISKFAITLGLGVPYILLGFIGLGILRLRRKLSKD